MIASAICCSWLSGEKVKKCVVLQVNDAAVSWRMVVVVSKVQLFYTQIQMGEGREERGATPLTCCVGWRSSGQGPPLIPWREAHNIALADWIVMLKADVLFKRNKSLYSVIFPSPSKSKLLHVAVRWQRQCYFTQWLCIFYLSKYK